MRIGKLDRRIEILAPTQTREPEYGALITSWTTLAMAWANVQDVLPSRAERALEGIDLARRPSRIRMRWRNDITADMQLQIGDRRMRIIAGPVGLGRRDMIEIMAEDYTTSGTDA